MFGADPGIGRDIDISSIITDIGISVPEARYAGKYSSGGRSSGLSAIPAGIHGCRGFSRTGGAGPSDAGRLVSNVDVRTGRHDSAVSR